MKRRSFLASGLAGSAAGFAPLPLGAAAETTLPETQWAPHPDLGSHWEVFGAISKHCTADMSYLKHSDTEPGAWTELARERLRAGFHYVDTSRELQPEVLEREDGDGFIRERVAINTTAGVRAVLYLLIPKNLEDPAPGVVALHDHGGFYLWGKEKLTRVDPVHPELQAFKDTYYAGNDIADELARRGYVVVVPDMIHWGERGLYFDADPERIKNRTLAVTAEDIKQFNARSWAHEELLGRTGFTAGTTVSGIITWDDQCAADYLCSRPEVDSGRVGCVGLSLGSVRSIFLGALHPKVRASVAVCWMAEYQALVRNNVRWAVGFTKLVPGLYGDLDWPDLAGLHWPGALMTINGLQDKLYPLDSAKSAVRKIGRIFEAMDIPDNYEGVFFDGPHEFNQAMQDKAFGWLAEQLK